MATETVRKLYRSKKNRIIAGVCGGIADYLTTDPTIIRIIYALLAVFTGIVPLVLVYLILWVLIPEQP